MRQTISRVFVLCVIAYSAMVVAGDVIRTYPESSQDGSLLSAYRAIQTSQARVTAASANGLIGYWSFDEGTGTTAADGSGSGNTGALTYGPVWATAANCKVGGCLQLDGVNDYVKVNNSAPLQLTGDVTISAWIKPTGLGVKQSIVSKRYEYELGEITTTSPYTLNWSHKASGGTLVSGALVTAINANQWQHVVLVRDAAARQYKGFKNGVPVATTAYSLDPGTSTYNVNIGRNPGSNQWFKGLIDEVRIYNRALTDAEVQQLYNESGSPPPPDTEAPTTPTNLSATPVSVSQINLSWNASTDNVGVTGYKVYRSGAEIAAVTTTSYQNSGLTPATMYTYTVAAVDATNNVSAQSTSASATTPAADTQAPSIPANLIAFSVSSSQIDLTWNPSTDNVGVSGYRIYRDGSQIATTPATTYSDTGLAGSTTYTYAIAAYDAAGNVSTPSASASATTQTPPPPDTEAPTPPTNLTANPVSPSRINLSWSASTDDRGVTGYRVYRNGSQINTPASTTYADTGLAASTTYNYTVAAEDAAGNVSAQSAPVSATTLAASPSVTFEVRLIGSSNDAEESASGSVSLTSSDLELVNDSSNQTVGMRFANVLVPNGATITNAYIQFVADEPSTQATSLLIFGEAADNTATYTTAASNVSSRSRTSAPVVWNPPNWNVVGEAGVNQRTSNITSVIGQIISRPGWLYGNALAIVITGAGKQVAYAYDGNASQAPLLHIEYSGGALPPDTTPPTTPTNSYAAAVSSTQVNLYWNASVDNIGVAGYKIYRNGVLAATTANTNYIDTGLSPQTTYSYTLAAYDATGNESLNTIAFNATTLAPGQTFAVTFVGAGDIADGDITEFDFTTAEQIDQIVALDPNTIVYTLGDNAYNLGALEEYMSYYEPTWGRHFDRTLPSPGNHDHGTPGASGYLDYFCPSPNRCRFPGGTRQLYYSYNIGPWHIISLDSEQARNPGTPQYIWLQQDLANNPRTCTLAYWHVPYFGSSEGRGNRPTMRPYWDLLYAARADVVVNGHDHHYERFDPQDPDGVYDQVRGIRQFIAGSGGYALYDFQTPTPNSVVRQKSHGVLKFTLRETSYSWEFIGIDGFRDTGSETCNP